MNPGMKMLMLTARENGDRSRGGRSGDQRGGARNEMAYGRGNYAEMNDRGYDMDDRYEPEGNYDVENRRGGQRRDSRGRYTARNEYMGAEMAGDYSPESHYPMTPYVPPVYQEDYARPKQRIGFALEPSAHDRQYKQDAEYRHMDEMEHRTSPMMMGRAGGHSTKLTKEMADEWMEGLENEDGTKGPHWTLDQVKQVVAQRGLQIDPLSAYVVINMLYSDYCKVFKKYNVGDKLDFYVDMTKAFIEDKDAGEGKVAAYFEGIVKH